MNIRVITPKRLWPKSIAMLLKARLGKTIPYFEYELKRKDGTLIPVETGGQAIFKNGKPVAIQIITRDITERKKAEEALRLSEAKHRELINGMNDTAWVIDLDANFVDVNDAAVKVLGYSRAELLSMGPADIDSSLSSEEISKLVKNMPADQVQVFETTHTTKDGEKIPVEISSSLVNYQGKQAVLSIARNITERKKTEAKIQLQNAVLNGINKISQEALSARGEEELGLMCLSVAEEITQSKFGFIAEIKPSGLEDIAISNPSWEACRIIDAKGHRRQLGTHKIHGIYGRVLKDGKALFTNDPAKHQDSIGVPNGHPPLKAFLGVPLKREGNTIGMVGVGNREGGYTQEEQQTLETLAPVLVEAFMRKRAENAVRQSEVRYRGLYEAVSSGIVAQDKEGRIIEANDMAYEILGLTRDQMQGRTSMDPRWHPIREDGSPFPGNEHPAMITLRTGKPIRNIIMGVFYPKDGTHRWIQVNSEPIIDPYKHNVKGVMTTFLDITKSKKTEEDLRVSEARFHAISNSVRDAIILVNDREKIEYWNPAAEKTFGYTREEALGQKVHELVVPSSMCTEGKMAIKRGVAQFAQTGKGVFMTGDIELIAGKKDGSEFPVKLSLSPIKLGNKWHAVGVAKDITEQKQNEQMTRDYSEKLEKAIAARTNELQIAQASLLKLERLAVIGELAGMVGHDLRNPLTGIKNAAYYLRVKQGLSFDANSKKMLEIIDSAIDHADKIIGDLQDYSREMHLERANCSPRAILQEALALVQVPDRVKIIDNTLGEPLIRADNAEMVRVFINIIKNAVDAMPEGGTLQVKSVQTDGNVEISFADTGIGMSEETLSKIFSPLVTTKAQGMGFGLAICKRIVEAHKGRITVQSVEGKGSTFTVIIPIEPKLKDGGEATWINVPESLLLTTTKT